MDDTVYPIHLLPLPSFSGFFYPDEIFFEIHFNNIQLQGIRIYIIHGEYI